MIKKYLCITNLKAQVEDNVFPNIPGTCKHGC